MLFTLIIITFWNICPNVYNLLKGNHEMVKKLIANKAHGPRPICKLFAKASQKHSRTKSISDKDTGPVRQSLVLQISHLNPGTSIPREQGI